MNKVLRLLLERMSLIRSHYTRLDTGMKRLTSLDADANADIDRVGEAPRSRAVHEWYGLRSGPA